ncbi:MAG: molecular chaperone HtpG [Mycoplasmatales bacterium]
MAKKKFKTESRQILDLMIHSIYSNKDVFLRELISNASDAMDKRHFVSLQDESYKEKDFKIELELDKVNRIISIIDNGIGMNATDLDNNLGTIAKSGTKEFMEKIKSNEEEATIADQIGQFGVGFYSSFIVSDKVTVITKKPNEQAFKWESDGVESYSVNEIDSDVVGTKISLHLREGEEFDQFLEETTIKSLIKKYSDFIKYPIMMEVQKNVALPKENEEDETEYELVTEMEKLNSQESLWKKNKRSIKEEDYANFYMAKYHDYQAPLHTIHVNVEGTMTFDLLLFVPKNKPYDYLSPSYKKGLDLYSKGVLIESNVDYLLDDGFNFVRGLVDCSDINLNISREMLQKDATVTKLATAIQTQIKKNLQKLLKSKRETYELLFTEFGQQLTFGVYNDFGARKDLFQDLLMFKSNIEQKYVTLKEYTTNHAEQENIYYVAGNEIEQINKLPVMENITDQTEVLYFLNDIDEFAIQALQEYNGKKFKSIALEDFVSDDEKKAIEKQTEENAGLMEALKQALTNKVSDVKLTTKLSESAVCLTAKEGLSLEMEKILAQMPGNDGFKATKVLEINPKHELFAKLSKIDLNNEEEVKLYADILFDQACIVEGVALEDPATFAKNINKLLLK